MKHHGATVEHLRERSDDLMKAYDLYISSCKYIRMRQVYAAIVEMPSRRFWVSGSRATKVVYAIMRGDSLAAMRPLKREMFHEIYRRVCRLRDDFPCMSVADCCCWVVEQPAPKFYLAPGSAKIMVCKARKRWIRAKLERLRRSL